MKTLKHLPYLLIALTTLALSPRANAAVDEAALRLTIMQGVNLVEIRAGQRALKASENAVVRDYAKPVVDRHEKWSQEIGEYARKRNIQPVDITRNDATPMEKELVAQLNTAKLLDALTGAELDKAFADLMVKVHKLSVENLNTSGKSLKDTETGRLLADLLPLVKAGLENAKKLVDKVK